MGKRKEYEQLWAQLPLKVEANLAFTRLVVSGEPINTKYFFGDYSFPILKWVIITLYTPRIRTLERCYINLQETIMISFQAH